MNPRCEGCIHARPFASCSPEGLKSCHYSEDTGTLKNCRAEDCPYFSQNEKELRKILKRIENNKMPVELSPKKTSKKPPEKPKEPPKEDIPVLDLLELRTFRTKVNGTFRTSLPKPLRERMGFEVGDNISIIFDKEKGESTILKKGKFGNYSTRISQKFLFNIPFEQRRSCGIFQGDFIEFHFLGEEEGILFRKAAD